MYLLAKQFTEIDWNVLEQARIAKVEESRTLDFKRDLPNLESKESKREFLEDVCALANTSGGVLLYGVEESRDEHTKLGHIESLPGFDHEARPADFKSRVQELVRSSFDPRFSGVNLDWIESPDKARVCLKVGVERSPLAPHRVTSNGSREFMVRSMTSSEKMDAEQIREAVRRSLNAMEEVTTRLSRLSASAAEIRIDGFATLWGCAAPSFRTSLPQTIGDPIVSAALSKLRDTHAESGLRVKYDHLGATLALWKEPFTVLDRVQRDGTVERFDFVPLVIPPKDFNPLGKTWIVDRRLADALVTLGQVLIALRRDVGVGGSMVVGIGLFGVAGTTLEQIFAPTKSGGPRGFREPTPEIPSGQLLLDPTETSDEFVGRIVKAAANLFWNAGGHPFCAGIDEEGKRTPGLA